MNEEMTCALHEWGERKFVYDDDRGFLVLRLRCSQCGVVWEISEHEAERYDA